MASPTVSPAQKPAEQLNVYRVTYTTRVQPGAAPIHSHAIVVAHNDFEAGAHVARKSVLHPKKVTKDAAGHEQILSPEQHSIEVVTIRTVEQNAQIAGSVQDSKPALAFPVTLKPAPPTPME